MNNVEPLIIRLKRDDIVKEFSKAVRYHLSKKEQEELADELLSCLETPPNCVGGFADLIASLEENGGHLDATKGQCWEMSKKDSISTKGL